MKPIDKDIHKKPIRFFQYLSLAILVVMSLSLYLYSRLNKQLIKIDTLSDPVANPLMGWAPWATIKESNQPHTLVYANLMWRDFEPQEGYYDFDSFEKKQQLARWRQEGKRVVFRFVADEPGSETHLDIPDWLFKKMNGSGEFYDNEYGKGFSPDYSNPVFIEYHRKVIKILGEKYGKDGFFAFIELGSLGHWGEWHTHPGITPLPSADIRNLYVNHYVEAFPGTHLLMRRPFSIAKGLGLGLYNDMTGDPAETTTWLDWIRYGGEYPPEEMHSLSPMPDGWQKAPMGGEQAPTLSDEQIYDTDLEQTLQLLKQSHTTFIGPGSPYKVSSGNPLQYGIDQVMSTIGYRLYLDHVEMPKYVFTGGDVKVTLTFSNNGIAPISYNWPTRMYLFDKSGNTVSTYEPSLDLRKFLPGGFYNVHINVPIRDLKDGIYSLGIAIIDPITDQPGVKFTNKNARQDLILAMGSFEVKRLFSSN